MLFIPSLPIVRPPMGEEWWARALGLTRTAAPRSPHARLGNSMTLNSTTTKATYNGDGSATVFTVSFIYWSNSDLRVIHCDANDAETVWVRGRIKP